MYFHPMLAQYKLIFTCIKFTKFTGNLQRFQYKTTSKFPNKDSVMNFRFTSSFSVLFNFYEDFIFWIYFQKVH